MKPIAFSRRILLAAVLATVAAGCIAQIVTSARAAGSASAAEYQYGTPAPTKAPALSGSAVVGQKLTTTNGSWSSPTPISAWAYRWARCDAKGANCLAIVSATSSTYTVTATDVGYTLRAYVWATNAVGTTAQFSAPSAVVASSASSGSSKVRLAASVVLPNRLVINAVSYSQNPIRSRLAPTRMRIHVNDGNGKSVQGALVYAIGVPYNRIANAPEVPTDSTGWATVSLSPLKSFPRTGYLVLFLRARVQGQDLLGGTSTRRLVQVSIGVPNGS
jgi:hypothetical protein